MCVPSLVLTWTCGKLIVCNSITRETVMMDLIVSLLWDPTSGSKSLFRIKKHKSGQLLYDRGGSNCSKTSRACWSVFARLADLTVEGVGWVKYLLKVIPRPFMHTSDRPFRTRLSLLNDVSFSRDHQALEMRRINWAPICLFSRVPKTLPWMNIRFTFRHRPRIHFKSASPERDRNWQLGSTLTWVMSGRVRGRSPVWSGFLTWVAFSSRCPSSCRFFLSSALRSGSPPPAPFSFCKRG